MQILSTNITSPLGMNTEDNYQAVKSGNVGVAYHEDRFDLPFGFEASLFSEAQWSELLVEGCTRFESIVIHSIKDAVAKTEIDISSDRVVWILSTTKGNVELLNDNDTDSVMLGTTAGKIARKIGITTEPIVVCNACISGLSAQVLALRLVDNGIYDYAIVTGADVQGPFIVSGFNSLKALSAHPCRPFDINRLGLNLGEAAATIVYGNTEITGKWYALNGAISNDAYHISGPHPQGEGCMRAINQTLGGVDKNRLGVVSVHGTATMYNDQMESKAISRAELSSVPLSALKGYYGHTMGAAGVLETIITSRALEDAVILPTMGFEEIGVSGKVSISSEERRTEKKTFLKILSGFGGCNAAMLFTKEHSEKHQTLINQEFRTIHEVSITNDSVVIDDRRLDTKQTGKQLLTEVYKNEIGSYPKFYKMDMLSRLAFVASELVKDEGYTDEETSVVFFNASSSIVSDAEYLNSIKDKDNFFPSPSVFVYTLPNISTGEISLRNAFHGETSFYILREKNETLMDTIIKVTMSGGNVKSMITGWIDCYDENNFNANIKLISK